MESLETFIKNNSAPLPKAPSHELEQILSQIDRGRPWYHKFDFTRYILVPAMTLTLVAAISFSLFTGPQVNQDNLDNYIAESFDIYDPMAEKRFLD